MTCRELVELVTDYLEGRLPEATTEQLEAHIANCDGCTVYIEQMRLTLVALGHIPEETISPAAQDELIAAFRELRASA
jgi:anti-sigma factor RsiW